jgi:hypothetical protein
LIDLRERNYFLSWCRVALRHARKHNRRAVEAISALPISLATLMNLSAFICESCAIPAQVDGA